MVTNTGTYLDSPFNFDSKGNDLADLSLEMLAGLPAIVVDARDQIEVGIGFFRDLDVSGKAGS